MLFNSYVFILFLGIALAFHYLPVSWKSKKINLLVAGYLFYAMWNPPFVLLLWLSTVVDFIVGKQLYQAENQPKRKALLLTSLGVNLGMLAFFKYGGFLLDNFILLASALGIDFHPAAPDIILPVGISFYTFQTLSYTLDMYRRKHAPERSLLDFSLYVSFFPQLVAGPIVRTAGLLPQFKSPRQANSAQFMQGLLLLSLGLFMKVVLADGLLSGPADQVFGAQMALNILDAWMGVLAFSGQIFFDFAGYTTCAIGVAALLGFTLPDNFCYPYAAIGFSDFWRRWHISLSTWLRDYLYIPLGGNRAGKARTYINLMITMLVGGLWHGASWTFVAWGGLHGLYLTVEKWVVSRRESRAARLPQPEPAVQAAMVEKSALPILHNEKAKALLLVLLTFLLVNVTWVFFRATDFSTAWRLLSSMFGLAPEGTALLPTIDIIKVSVVTLGLLLTHFLMRNTTVSALVQKSKWWTVGIAWGLMLVAIIISQKSGGSFIYFQF
ncbi:MAG: MBOAT family protein [Lewinellaceae bacterium]|nr:MBOAT family protein [Phaeodactylibacter sp.]MCB9035591.1 MBOAT family protein [Lewinellaceae bacterium]